MSGNYTPLYRKYRPQTLDTLVGQEHIKKTLASAIELGKISHAYLFTGPRGTGKTSTARILAKSLNCKNGPTVHPCGECESCKDITNSIPIDVIEIDAASNRKVEDARDILEKIQYIPVNGKYKIYIIDEVHMLTKEAFNTLLKTLEEPPENVIFILATTEVHKVLDTIKSRCQRFDFRRITTDDIVKHLRWISNKEKIKITDDALFAIAKNSAGGMRDSISLLDQLSILGFSKEITIDDVNSILGRISFDVLYKLSNAIITSSSASAIEILNEVYNSGNEPLQIMTNLNEYFKNLLVAKTCSEDLLPELTSLNETQIKELLVQTKALETQQIVFLIERISYYIKEIKLSVNQHLWLEVGIIDLSNMSENSTLLDLQNRVRALEGKITLSEQAQPISVVTRPAPIQPAKKETILAKDTEQKIVETISEQEEMFAPPPISKKSDGNNITSLWNSILSNITVTSTQGPLKHLATPLKIDEEEVIITFATDFWVNSINNDTSKKELIKDAIKKVFGKDIPLIIKVAKEDNKNTVQNSTTEKQNPVIQESKTTTENDTVLADTKPEKKQINKPAKETTLTNAKHQESDQEKMIIDLFDGKYVE